jgi:O-methyltransferase domain/Dimerisation domain
VPEPATELLKLMTGAWQTQAITVAAEMRIADRLAEGLTTENLAAEIGADHDSLHRLLRYLAGMGIVRSAGDRFELTELGQPLQIDAPNSLHPLALLYGGAFYQSFGHLKHAVRTGQDAFGHAFGKNHFDYFAEHPELQFNQAMAASAAIFGQLTDIIDFSTARTVVDIAGGNGELLGHILRAVPHVHGVLLERSDVAASAGEKLAPYLDRCTVIAGDFTRDIPPGGDIYLLSRVLHDWGDDQCTAILKRCAESMAPGAALLIVERLLPEDDSPSLAAGWDVHMLCNVGGRERTASRYAQLLTEAGFTTLACHALPLEFAVLRAQRT